ncbi:hypothetical protein ABZ016_40055 [Streptomyces sp. NPDC006372]|uniref:hypothetical protein n=1 Tax=Streptomyces sp. NPDC006372 TaxID=3155599 RepID=UPI0033BB72A9
MNRTEQERRKIGASIWRTYELGNVPGVEFVAYGVVRPQHDPEGVPMVRARDIVDGAVDESNLARISLDVNCRHPRTSLQPGDLLVVLVGRVGDTAVATRQHQGWNVARSVAVIRFSPDGLANGISTWIRWWLRTPQAHGFLRACSANAEHATLPLSDLKQVPVSLPAPHLRARLLRTMSLVERRMELNTQIAARATELADAYFARYAQENRHAYQPGLTIADVSRVVGGSPIARSAAGIVDGAVAIAWVAPREVLNSTSVQLDRTAETSWAPRGAACNPGTLLVAPRPGEVKTVMSTISVIPGRGTLAIQANGEPDRMWLLHDLRSRSQELVATAQGEQARAMSRKAFSRLNVSWPSATVRKRFAEIAAPLHDRAHTALAENRALEELVASEMAGRLDGER